MDFMNFNVLQLFTPMNMLCILGGTIFGTLIGAMPGLGATVGCALLIPLTFSMDEVPALLLLVSLYMASQYGGSISSITLGIPGTPAAVVTVLDGSPIAKRGEPGRALGYSLAASTIGGLFGCVVLILATRPMAKLAVQLADPELFLIGILGLMSVIAIGAKDMLRCVIALLLGLLCGTVGSDFFTGAQRFTFGSAYLSDGINIVGLLAGFYALSEVFEMVTGDMTIRYVTDVKKVKCRAPWKEFKEVMPHVIKSSAIGTLFGVIPGLGGGSATWFAYGQAKRSAKHPELFGDGSVEGLSSAESANNAVVGGGLVPLLSLGIPGTSTAAIILGALVLQGIQPGPHLFDSKPDLVYSIYWGLLIATIMMFIVGRYATSLFARLLVCPNYVLVPIVITALLIGAYAARYFTIDIWIAIIAGAIVFFMKRLDFSLPAFTLAFVLAELIENRFRRSLLLSKGSFSIFFTRPICIVIWVLIVLMFVLSIRSSQKEKDRKKAETNQKA